MKKVVVVAPTYNEEENIEAFITNVLAQQIRIPDYELGILISDSHSKDKTEQIVRHLMKKEKRIHYLDVEKRGLGLGISQGLNYAIARLDADILLTMEADLSNDPNKIPDFLEKMKKADIVVGSRYTKGGGIVNWSWWRKGLSLSANSTLRLLAGRPKLHEFTNLYRVFKKDVWIALAPEVGVHTGWLFVPAFIFESINSKFRILEEPFVFYDRSGGHSKMNTISYTKDLLIFAIMFRLKKLWSIFSNS